MKRSYVYRNIRITFQKGGVLGNTCKGPGADCIGSKFHQDCKCKCQTGTAKSKRVIFRAVMAYQNADVVARIAKELRCSLSKAKALFKDVRRFLWMAAKSGKDVIPTPIIDEAWHVFVLFTQDYAKFCQRFFGGFLHHIPHKASAAKLPLSALHPTIDAMHETFGGPPSGNWHYSPIVRSMKEAA